MVLTPKFPVLTHRRLSAVSPAGKSMEPVRTAIGLIGTKSLTPSPALQSILWRRDKMLFEALLASNRTSTRYNILYHNLISGIARVCCWILMWITWTKLVSWWKYSKENMMEEKKSLAVSPYDSNPYNGQVVKHVPFMLVSVGLKHQKIPYIITWWLPETYVKASYARQSPAWSIASQEVHSRQHHSSWCWKPEIAIRLRQICMHKLTYNFKMSFTNIVAINILEDPFDISYIGIWNLQAWPPNQTIQRHPQHKRWIDRRYRLGWLFFPPFSLSLILQNLGFIQQEHQWLRLLEHVVRAFVVRQLNLHLWAWADGDG